MVALYEGHSVFLSLRCQSKKYNTDLHRMFYISSNKSPWWCAQSFSCFHRPEVTFLVSFFFSKPLIYSRSDFTLTSLLLTEKASCSLEHNKNSQGANIVIIWYATARKHCVVVGSQVKISSCTLSYKTCNLTRVCLQHQFVTNLTIFAKLKYYFDINKLAITLQSTRNKELSHFPIFIRKYRVLHLLRCEKSQSSWRSFYSFFSV